MHLNLIITILVILLNFNLFKKWKIIFWLSSCLWDSNSKTKGAPFRYKNMSLDTVLYFYCMHSLINVSILKNLSKFDNILHLNLIITILVIILHFNFCQKWNILFLLRWWLCDSNSKRKGYLIVYLKMSLDTVSYLKWSILYCTQSFINLYTLDNLKKFKNFMHLNLIMTFLEILLNLLL